MRLITIAVSMLFTVAVFANDNVIKEETVKESTSQASSKAEKRELCARSYPDVVYAIKAYYKALGASEELSEMETYAVVETQKLVHKDPSFKAELDKVSMHLSTLAAKDVAIDEDNQMALVAGAFYRAYCK